MSDRLAEIEATRKKILSEYEFSRADDDMLMLLTSGIPWLLARIRELEAQAARDAAVVEAALEIYPDLANAPVIAAALAAREEATDGLCDWRPDRV